MSQVELFAGPLLSVHDLSVTYSRRHVRPTDAPAVDGVSFEIPKGTTLALVGESGSGKSTIGNSILGLVRPSAGVVEFCGTKIVDANRVERKLISQRIQIVFQDPFGSLNPSRTIAQTLVEPLLVKGRKVKSDRNELVLDALRRVGLPKEVATRYPAQFSGGQRQRIAMARAIVTKPELVILDEPVSSLDLSVQAQILNLLNEMQEQEDLSYLFISHDLGVVQRMADSIVILYRGRIVESGDAKDVALIPHHPYTVALLNAAPVPDPRVQQARRIIRKNQEVKRSRTDDVSGGCQFAPRCPLAVDICREFRPELRRTSTGTFSACHRANEVSELLPRM